MSHTPPISVIGCGYLGATHAAALAHNGFQVVGIDTDPAKIATLKRGRAPFHEPDLDELLFAGVNDGRLLFTNDIGLAAYARVHFLCVGTPQLPGSDGYDLRHLDSVIEQLVPHLGPGHVVVGKSTVPVGTAARYDAIVSATGAELLLNPEFLREGFAVADSLRPDRIVIGARHPESVGVTTLRTVYEPQIAHSCPVLTVDLATAELVKTAANAFLAMKISFINAIAEVCSATEADVVSVAQAIGLDDRIGPKFLRAGLGFGGGCLPKDIRGLADRALGLGAYGLPHLLEAVDEINLAARTRAVYLAARHVPEGGRAVVLGAAFKPDSDDLRDSPAIALAKGLCELGIAVVICDPVADGDRIVELVAGATVCDSPYDAVLDADVVVLATEWGEYLQLDPVKVGELMRARNVLDARNALPARAWVDAGFVYESFGRKVTG